MNSVCAKLMHDKHSRALTWRLVVSAYFVFDSAFEGEIALDFGLCVFDVEVPCSEETADEPRRQVEPGLDLDLLDQELPDDLYSSFLLLVVERMLLFTHLFGRL